MIESALPEIEGVKRSINYGFDRIRFLSPVPSGSQIRGRFELLRAEVQRDTEVTLCCRATIDIRNHERPALVADWLVRYYLA
jgi:acyl dehydratase